MDSNGRFRHKRNSFAMISNEIIRNTEISLKAKGLYALIQSYVTIDNFTLYKGFLQSKCIEGERAFDGAWKELKEHGYLVQYRMRDEKTCKIYWEYELLDSPQKPYLQNVDMEAADPYLQNDGMEKKNPSLRFVGDTKCIGYKAYGIQNVGNNNTISNNTLKNNTISNHIISEDDVRDQIGSDALQFDSELVDSIVLLIQEILSIPNNSVIRVSKMNLPAEQVQNRFRKLEMCHIEYVLSVFSENTVPVRNQKAYLITSLYNAPTTMNTYFQNKVNQIT